ncbi:MAG: EAL domain-containing protein [Minwuia sp.]|nr:EAL domain-containing protein [Minwuia sp.]
MPFTALTLFHLASLLVAAAIGVATFRFVPETSVSDATFTGLLVLALGVMSGEGAARRLERRLLLRSLDAERAAREGQAEAIAELTAELDVLRQHRDQDELVTEMRLVRSQLARIASGHMPTAGRGAAGPVDGRPMELEGQPLIEAVLAALKDNRIDLYLQPVVQLPQRRVAFHECLTRLRDSENRVIAPHQYMPVAEQAGLTDTIDNLSLFRCVQALKRRRNEDAGFGFFCNLSMATLEDEAFFEQFLEFLVANRDLAGRLVFEVEAERLLQATATVAEHLDSLKRIGFRLSVDNIDRGDIDLMGLASRGVAFAKVDAHALKDLARPDRPLPVLVEKLRAKGMVLIAAKVENEEQVLELVEDDLTLAQGYLFGEPRPMRADA